MASETNLEILVKTMKPVLNSGSYVFCTVDNLNTIELQNIVTFFKEEEGYTIMISKGEADRLKLDYGYVAAWITLTVHSSLDAVGLTAVFSNALAAEGISCNVVAGFHHDHIFVAIEDAQKAMVVLQALAA
jgi:hypothetical protein